MKKLKKKQPMKARAVRIDDELWNKINKSAKQYGVKASEMARMIIGDFYQV